MQHVYYSSMHLNLKKMRERISNHCKSPTRPADNNLYPTDLSKDIV